MGQLLTTRDEVSVFRWTKNGSAVTAGTVDVHIERRQQDIDDVEYLQGDGTWATTINDFSATLVGDEWHFFLNDIPATAQGFNITVVGKHSDSTLPNLPDGPYYVTVDDADSIRAEIDNATYGLSALNDDLDNVLTRMGVDSGGFSLHEKLGAFTSTENLKAILGDLSTAKRLGNILGDLDETDTLDAIIGAYTASSTLKAAIDDLDSDLVNHESNRSSMESTLVNEHDTTQSKVDKIGAAAEAVLAGSNEFTVPDSGTNDYKLTFVLKDLDQDPVALVDPDNNRVTVTVENQSGASPTGVTLSDSDDGTTGDQMTRDSQGEYSMTITIDDTADIGDQLIFRAEYDQGGVTNIANHTGRVVDIDPQLQRIENNTTTLLSRVGEASDASSIASLFGHIKDLDEDLVSHESARASMETALVAEHDSTQADLSAHRTEVEPEVDTLVTEVGAALVGEGTLHEKLGAFTSTENLKAILGNLSTSKRLGNILGDLDETDTLDAIIGAYTADSTLKAAIDDLDADLVTHDSDVKTELGLIKDGGAGTFDPATDSLEDIRDENKTEHDSTQTDIAAQNDPDSATIADAVWDEVLTGATHNVPSSAGRRLRDLTANVVANGTVVSSTNNTATLSGDEPLSTVDDQYDPGLILITEGTGKGQARRIIEYDGGAKTVVIKKAWRVNPDDTSKFVIFAEETGLSINEGLLQGATATTATLNTRAAAQDDIYVGQAIWVVAGPGNDQIRIIEEYDGTTKVATVTDSWTVQPDDTSSYVLVPLGRTHTTKFFADAKADIDAIDDELADAAHGLAALNADLDDILSRIGIDTGGFTLHEKLGAFTDTDNLKAVLGAFDSTENLKAVLGAYSSAATLKDAIDAHESNRAIMESTLVAEHDDTQSELADSTYGLSALNDDLDDIINRIGSKTDIDDDSIVEDVFESLVHVRNLIREENITVSEA